MKRSTFGMLTILIALAAMLVLSPSAYALDPPHNAYDTSNGYSITCSSCHYDVTTSSTPSWMTAPTTTYTQLDNLCLSCHSAGKFSDTTYADMGTHAAVNTSHKYGNWYIECRTCHNPHYQQQAENYPTDPTANIVSGTVGVVSTSAGASQSSFTVTGPTLTVNNYINYLVVPNINYPTRLYRIASNTGNSITVYGALNPNYLAAGNTFAIRFGKLIQSQMQTPNSGVKTVKFFTDDRTQLNSFASSTDKATATGVCQVCHTQTEFFNSSLSSTFPIQDDSTHGGFSSPTQPCVTCHQHKGGFSPAGGCTGCHGDPPVDLASLVTTSGGTGQTTAGAHRTHAITLGFSCTTCHDNGMPSTPIPDGKLEMGFNLFNGTYIGGTYVTRGTLSNGFVYSAGNGSTTLTTTGTAMSCSNIYCHSNVQNPVNGVGGFTTSGTPSWAGTVQCGSCHNADGVQGNASLMSTGSHTKHVTLTTYAMACSTCHLNAGEGTAAHANGSIDLNFDTSKTGTASYSGSSVPGSGYGTCSATYCHGNFSGGTNGNTATWGNATSGACGTCHGATATAPPSGGAHSAHASTPGYAFGCNLCHNATTTTGTTITNFANHVNHSTDWAFSAADPRTNGALYKSANSGSNANVGTGYGTCSNLYCHSRGTANSSPYSAPNVTPDWGAAASFPTDCTGCHDANNGAASQMRTGSHTDHVVSNSMPCNDCHSKTVGTTAMSITNYSEHVNKTISIAFTSLNPSGLVNGLSTTEKTPGSSPAQCSNLYCHGAGSPIWSTNNGQLTCSSCHKANNTLAGRHSTHYAIATVATQTSKTPTDASAGANYAFSCGVCHNPAVTKHAGGAVSSIQAAEISFDPTIAGGGTYTAGVVSAGTDSTFNWTAGTCSATYCHSQGTKGTAPYSTPNVTNFNWNSAVGTLTCSGCHTGDTVSGPTYTNGSPKANSHNKHCYVNHYTCDKCHFATTTTGTTITDKSKHINGLYDIAPGTSVSFSATAGNFTTPTQCSNISCHGGTTATVTWGATNITCSSCHLSMNGEVADYTYGNSIVATISSTQWFYSGHGKTGGVYDATSNSAASLPTAAGTGDPCQYCHDGTVSHGSSTNVFRLRTTSTGTFMNDVCLKCHATGAAGVNPFSGTSATVVATNKVDKYHFGAEHSSTKSGGEFCWDCHTAHGDSTSTAGPIAMFRAKPWMVSSSTGTPLTMVSTTVTFTSLNGPYSFGSATVSGGTYGNVCNVCHVTAQDATMTHYTTTGSDGHNAGAVCTQCHSHSSSTTLDGNAFAGAGSCNACHGYPPAISTYYTISSDGKPYIGSDKLGKGAHPQHVLHIMSQSSYTWGALDPANDTFTSAKVAAVCGVCHDTTTNANHPNASNMAVMLINSAYQFSSTSSPTYLSNSSDSTVTNKSCSNVSCHFQASPLWQQTAGQ